MKSQKHRNIAAVRSQKLKERKKYTFRQTSDVNCAIQNSVDFA